jgi:undecaprenyl diphosphate synthase
VSPIASLATSSCLMSPRRAPLQKYFASDVSHKAMIRYIYEQLLESQISKENVPGCVAIILSPGDLDAHGLEMISKLIHWSEVVGIDCIALYVQEDDVETYHNILSALSRAPAEISLHTKDMVQTFGTNGRIKLLISLGYGGKHEVSEAIKKLLIDVEAGLISPQNIDEKTIEANLRFDRKPDLVIRAGGKQLSDFMIWQAAYSELYFTEVNWNSLRKIDFLRAIRDYQRRERRFGK